VQERPSGDVASFEAAVPQLLPPTRPRSYRVLQSGGRAVRARLADLPFRVSSPASQHPAAVRHAVAVWNRAGEAAGVGPFFVLAEEARPADLPIDWSGRGLRPQAAAMTRMTLGRHRAVPR